MTPIAMFPIMAALSLPMPKEEFKDSVFSISKAGEVVVTATRTPKLLKNTAKLRLRYGVVLSTFSPPLLSLPTSVILLCRLLTRT